MFFIMQLSKKLFLFLSILLVIFITGCDGLSSSSSSTTSYQRSGFEGIVMNFMENAPSDTIIIDSSANDNAFETIIELKNLGSYPKEGDLVGKIFIGGFDKTVIDGKWEGNGTLPTELHGKSELFPSGSLSYKSYYDNNIEFNFKEADNYEPTIQVTACYKYKTYANPMVCVDPNPTSTKIKNKVCSIEDITLSGGQGAPVSVTKVEQVASSKETIFKIYIKNSGTGTVIKKDKYEQCMNLNYDESDRVEIDVKLSNLEKKKCTPAGTSDSPIRLVNGEGLVVCIFKNPTSGEAYSSPLEITLNYGYLDSISKKVNIVNYGN
jgi:hypothetical protein